MESPEVTNSLRHLDYKYTEITTDEFAEMLTKKLKQLGAKIWFMDVYCSNGSVYRNIKVKWDGVADRAETIAIRFNREEGRILTVRNENE